MSVYAPIVQPFNFRRLVSGEWLAISESGDFTFTTEDELDALQNNVARLSLERQAELKARFFLSDKSSNTGRARLLASRRAARRSTVAEDPSLHIVVPTLQCAHSCQYCQVSRALTDSGHAMSPDDVEQVCSSIFESKSRVLTIEFQGGDPLIRFDLVKHAIARITEINRLERRSLRFVVASTLHQLTNEMCDFFAEHQVYLSTSIDGPQDLHNRNRPAATRDSFQRTVEGIQLARHRLGAESVSALMTCTRTSLAFPDEVVDQYVTLGLHDIFLRPLSSYGFAKRNQPLLGYSADKFQMFYERALKRILHWNRAGVELREVYASIILNKILSTFDSGYVDLQSPNGAGSAVLVYNYDGFVYPSDEARMLAETGDRSLRLGKIGTPLAALTASKVRRRIVDASTIENFEDCRTCAYNQYCAPNPVDAQAQFGTMHVRAPETEHCNRHTWLFDFFFEAVRTADDWTLDLFHRWAAPAGSDQHAQG